MCAGVSGGHDFRDNEDSRKYRSLRKYLSNQSRFRFHVSCSGIENAVSLTLQKQKNLDAIRFPSVS